jgi:hypothetical protein
LLSDPKLNPTENTMSIAETTPVVSKWAWPRFTNERTKRSIPAVLWALHEMGGEVADPQSGRVPAKIVAKAQELGWPVHPGTNTSMLFAELENGRYGRCLYRETNGKRTFLVRLLLTDEEMPPKPHAIKTYKVDKVKPESVFASAPPIEPDPEPEPEQPTPAPKPVPDDPNVTLAVAPEPEPEVVAPTISPLVGVDAGIDPIDLLFDIQRLSMTAVVALATTAGTPDINPDNSDERDAERARLATTLEENNRLRRKLNEATETLVAKSKEIEALRKALAIAQNNLRAVQDAANAAPNRERALANLRNTQKFMSEKPRAGVV